jgi:hypothetical protein
LKGTLGDRKTSFAIYNSGGRVQLAELDFIGSGIYRKTFTWKNTSGAITVADESIYVYALYDSVKSESSIEWIKLEKGSIATDWSPATEELLPVETREY